MKWIHSRSYADDKGDAYRIINGVDSFGNVCGRKNTHPDGAVNNTNLNMEDFPHVYLTDPTNSTAPTICVSACPYHETSNFTSDVDACTSCTSTRARICP